MRCDVTSYEICISNQPQYLVADYDRYEKTVKGVIWSSEKIFSNETIITIENFSCHKHFKKVKQKTNPKRQDILRMQYTIHNKTEIRL